MHEPRRRGRVRDLFNDALEHTPTSRRRFLDQLGARDASLRDEVESLLSAYDADDAFAAADDRAPLGRAPDRVGSYELIDEIGRGGQAAVYRARHVGTGAEVALKVLAVPFARDAYERFQREAEIASRLDHPGLCKILDTGEADGVRYIAMEFVEGESLAECIARAREYDEPGPVALTGVRDESTARRLERVLELFERLASALHHAHERGLVHRDIKPANIVVRSTGEPVILDFGLVRDLESSVASMTRSADVLGTPHYLAPEQLATERVPVDRRTDIYSLGVTLFEALTVTRPFDAATRDGLYRRILVGGPPDPRRFVADLPRDITRVVEATLDVDAGRRYATAEELGADLRLLRAGRRVRVQRSPAVVRLTTWMRKNPIVSTVTIGAFVLVASALAIALTMLSEVESALDRMRITGLVQASEDVGRSDPELGLLLAREAVRRAPTFETVSQLQESLARLTPSRSLGVHDEKLVGAHYSPRGDRVLTSTAETARLWRVDGELVTSFDGEARGARFTSDGKFVVTATVAGAVRLHDASTGDVIRVLAEHPVALSCLSVDPVGSLVFSASYDGSCFVSSVDGSGTATFRATSVISAAFATDGETLITGHADATAVVRDLDGAERARVHAGGPLRQVCVAAGGVFATSTLRSVRLWNPDGSELSALPDQEAWIHAAAFSPDGTLLATSSADHTVSLWRRSGELLHRMRGHEAPVERVAFSPNGRALVTGSSDVTARVWDLHGNCERVLRGHEAAIFALSFSPDGRRLLTASADRTARLWELESPHATILRGHDTGLYDVQCSPDGRHIVTASRDRTARIWTSDGAPVAELRGHAGMVFSAAFAANDVVMTTDYGSTARWFDLEGTLRRQVRSATGRYFGNPDPTGAGRLLGRAPRNGVRIDDRDGAMLALLEGHGHSVWWAEFTIDGAFVVTASADRTARLWRTDGALVAEFAGHLDRVRSVRPSRSGQFFVTASDDATAAVWSREGELLARLEGHQGEVLHAAFSPDEQFVVTCSRDRTARVWRRDGTPEVVLRGHEGVVWVATFAPNGDVLTASSDRTARRWVVDESRLLEIADGLARPFTGPERVRFAELLAR